MIPISPNKDDIRNYLEKRLSRDDEPETMSSDLRADIVRVILEKISDMCEDHSAFPLLSMMHTYQRLCADFSLCRSTSTLF